MCLTCVSSALDKASYDVRPSTNDEGVMIALIGAAQSLLISAMCVMFLFAVRGVDLAANVHFGL